MYIISENDNLLERLRLLVLNSPLLEPRNGEADVAQSMLAKRRDLCEPTDRLIILMAKHWDQLTLETIGDAVRLMMAHCLHGKGRILVVKKDYDTTDQETLQNIVLDVRQQWCQEWTFQFEKVRKLSESAARSEALKRLDNWTAPRVPDYSIFHFDDPELPRVIAATLKLQNGLTIKDQFNRRPSLFSKPPALHWSHYPRESELQVMFKFTFPSGTMTEPIFRLISTTAKQSAEWEYDYEWTGGIFLRHDLTKISVYRANNSTIEIAGRIDNDEYQAEIEDDTQAELPFKQVWPLLARVLKSVVNECLEGKTDNGLPFLLNIAFFGSQFFKDINYVDVNGPVTARLLDATQALGALERTGSIKFGIGKRLVGIDLKQAFTGFQPHSLADLFAQAEQPVSSSRASSSPLPTAPPVISHTNIVLETNEEDDFPTSGPSHHHSLNNMERTSSQPGLLGMGIQNKNRGRRVSFGAIRAIPQTNGDGGLFMRESSLPPSVRSPRTPNSDTEDAVSTQASTPSQSSVQEYVDRLLQKTMDEVLVMD